MISNQILQHTLDGVRAISNYEFNVIDPDGNVLAGTKEFAVDFRQDVKDFVTAEEDSTVLKGYQLFKIYNETQLCYIVVIQGTTASEQMVGKMAAFQLQSLLVAYKERYNKEDFFKNLLLDNLLLTDIFGRAKKLHIDSEARRVVMIVETAHENDMAALDKVKSAFAERTKDFVIQMDDRHIAVIKTLEQTDNYESVQKNMEAALAFFGADQAGVYMACGTIIGDLKDLSRSFKEARMALDVGKIFFEEKKTIIYSALGIGRLIYQLPLPLCRMFIKEVFDKHSPEEFDEETLMTINKFFENSLNVSETSRQLFIHRNTLVYRLDRIQRQTGLDLRVFEDAITFKLALMVVKYMKYMEMTDR